MLSLIIVFLYDILLIQVFGLAKVGSLNFFIAQFVVQFQTLEMWAS